jgi:PEP-CTERM motif
MFKSKSAALFIAAISICFVSPASATLYDYKLTFTNPNGPTTTGDLILNVNSPTTPQNIDLPSGYLLNNGQSFTATVDGVTFSFSNLNAFDVSGGSLGNIAGDSAILPTSSLGPNAFLDLGGNFYQVEQSIGFDQQDQTGTYSITSITPFVAAVPEPSTWAMMILGFCGLGFVAYRRKPNSAPLGIA